MPTSESRKIYISSDMTKSQEIQRNKEFDTVKLCGVKDNEVPCRQIKAQNVKDRNT